MGLVFGIGARATVVLLELSVERLAPDAERAGGVGFVSGGVVESGFNCESFNLFH